jgi:hypothetical protein
MKKQRAEVFPRVSPPYRAYALDADGTRTPLEAHGLVVELRPGIEVEIDFAPHPSFAGRLTMYTPPTTQMRQVQEQGILDDFTVVFGAQNVLHVWVERRVTSRRPPWRAAEDGDKTTGPARDKRAPKRKRRVSR